MNTGPVIAVLCSFFIILAMELKKKTHMLFYSTCPELILKTY